MRSSFAAASGWLLSLTLLLGIVAAAPERDSSSEDNHEDKNEDLGDLLGGLGLPDVSTLLNSTITTLTALLQALESGQIVQNGLSGVLGADNSTAAAVSNNTLTSAGAGANVNASCPDLAVLFARGTSEPGNMGFLTGPPLATALQHYANGSRVAVQGVDYAATVEGFKEGGSPSGARLMAQLTNATMAACPSSRVVLAGYSQGAQVVRRACGLLPNATAAALSSVVLFGDPRNGTAVPGVDAARTLSVCHAGDNVCADGGALVLPPHLNYSGDAPAAAMFVMQKTGLGMASRDAVMQGMGDIPMMTTQ